MLVTWYGITGCMKCTCMLPSMFSSMFPSSFDYCKSRKHLLYVYIKLKTNTCSTFTSNSKQTLAQRLHQTQNKHLLNAFTSNWVESCCLTFRSSLPSLYLDAPVVLLLWITLWLNVKVEFTCDEVVVSRALCSLHQFRYSNFQFWQRYVYWDSIRLDDGASTPLSLRWANRKKIINCWPILGTQSGEKEQEGLLLHD